MKQEILELPKSPEQRMGAVNLIMGKLLKLDSKHAYEVVIRNQSAGKTLRQLRGHFGHVLKQVSDYTGEDVDYLHRHMKAKFLCKIYVEEPIGDSQAQWCELLDIYQRESHGKFEEHAKRISLEWISIAQMKRYMDEVIAYYRNNGVPVTEPVRVLAKEVRDAA